MSRGATLGVDANPERLRHVALHPFLLLTCVAVPVVHDEARFPRVLRSIALAFLETMYRLPG